MKFEEQFPGLVKNVFSMGARARTISPDRGMGPTGCIILWTFLEETIQEHCLDKQKVKDALLKLKKDFDKYHEDEVLDIDKFMKKELGLE